MCRLTIRNTHEGPFRVSPICHFPFPLEVPPRGRAPLALRPVLHAKVLDQPPQSDLKNSSPRAPLIVGCTIHALPLAAAAVTTFVSLWQVFARRVGLRGVWTVS